MKLVRLLALTFEEWPTDDSRVVVQDPSLNLYGGGGMEEEPPYYSITDNEWFGVWLEKGLSDVRTSALAEDYETAIVTKEMWLAEKEVLKQEQESVDSKLTLVEEIEGLPGIGSKMLFCAKGDWGYFQDDYPKLPHRCEVEILAHMNTLHGDVAVFKFLNEDDPDNKYYMVAQALADYFKPLPTEADILKEKNLDAIYGILGKAERPDSKADMAQAIYDAGFRPIKDV